MYNLSFVMCVCVLSHMWLFATPWTVASQAPLPWNFPAKNTGVGCHFHLQRIFPTQGLNLHLLLLLHWQAESLPLCHLGINFQKLFVICVILAMKYKINGFLIFLYFYCLISSQWDMIFYKKVITTWILRAFNICCNSMVICLNHRFTYTPIPKTKGIPWQFSS